MAKKLLLSVMVLIGAVLAGASNAMSVNFDVGNGSSVDVSRNNLVGGSISTLLDSGLRGTSFSLAPGQSRELDFFDITPSGCRIFCAGSATIDATLDLAAPPVAADGSGRGGLASVGAWITAGSLHWNRQPGIFNTAAGDFSVLFKNLHGLAFGSTYAVTATVTHLSAIPIPATAWLFGSVLLGLVGAARLRGARAKTIIQA